MGLTSTGAKRSWGISISISISISTGELHLATSPALARALTGAGFAKPFPWGAGNEEWLLRNICSEADASHAERLMRLAYDDLSSKPEAELLKDLA